MTESDGQDGAPSAREHFRRPPRGRDEPMAMYEQRVAAALKAYTDLHRSDRPAPSPRLSGESAFSQLVLVAVCIFGLLGALGLLVLWAALGLPLSLADSLDSRSGGRSRTTARGLCSEHHVSGPNGPCHHGSSAP